MKNGATQIFLLLDCSASMDEEITINGETITKLDLEKRFARSLVNNLLIKNSNVYIGLIIFRGQARKTVALTNNKSALLKGINDASKEQFEFTAYTNIYSALDKTINNGFVGDSNRFVFLLSDGIPTWDGTKQNQLVRTDVGVKDGNSTRVKKENDDKLYRIINKTKNKIEELENKGIVIYSVISREGLDSSLLGALQNIYQNDKNRNLNFYKEIASIADIQNVSVNIQDFIKEYVRTHLKVTNSEYTINQEDR